MAIEKIIKKNFKPGIIDKIAMRKVTPNEANLLVHCSCGKNYRVKEKIPNNIDYWTLQEGKTFIIGGFTKPSKCPKCKEEAYLQHVLYGNKEEGVTYEVRIITEKNAWRKK